MLKIEEKYIDYKSNPWGVQTNFGYDDFCIHNTYNDASADDEWSYMNKMQPNGHPTVTYLVDDLKAIKCMPINVDCWAVSDGSGRGGNTTDIHIEICYSKSGGEKYKKAFKNAMELISILCKDLGWRPEGRIKFHYDYGTKYCPHRSLDEFNGNVEKLRSHVIEEVNEILNEGEYKMKKLDDKYSRAEILEDENVRYGGKYKIKTKREITLMQIDRKTGSIRSTGVKIPKGSFLTTDYYRKIKSKSNNHIYNYHAIVNSSPDNTNLNVIAVDCDGD